MEQESNQPYHRIERAARHAVRSATAPMPTGSGAGGIMRLGAELFSARGYVANVRTGIIEVSIGCKKILLHSDAAAVHIMYQHGDNVEPGGSIWMPLTPEAAETLGNELIAAANRCRSMHDAIKADLTQYKAGGLVQHLADDIEDDPAEKQRQAAIQLAQEGMTAADIAEATDRLAQVIGDDIHDVQRSNWPELP